MRGKILLAIISIIIFSCDNQLSKEQRKALKEEMERREIKKISQDDIYKKALEQGAVIFEKLQKGKDIAEVQIDCKCQVEYSTSSKGLGEKPKAVYEAYMYDPKGAENIQKDGEYLIFSKPQLSSDSLVGVWFITMKKEEIIRQL